MTQTHTHTLRPAARPGTSHLRRPRAALPEARLGPPGRPTRPQTGEHAQSDPDPFLRPGPRRGSGRSPAKLAGDRETGGERSCVTPPPAALPPGDYRRLPAPGRRGKSAVPGFRRSPRGRGGAGRGGVGRGGGSPRRSWGLAWHQAVPQSGKGQLALWGRAAQLLQAL